MTKGQCFCLIVTNHDIRCPTGFWVAGHIYPYQISDFCGLKTFLSKVWIDFLIERMATEHEEEKLIGICAFLVSQIFIARATW